MKLPGRVQASLVLVLLVSAPLFVRCVSESIWVTTLATVLLVAGALAAFSGRTWGVGLTLLAGTAFGAAHLLGMAPSWFWAVAVAGALPFALTWKPMAFFDRPAAKLYAALAIGGGIACAVTWHEVGWWVVANIYP